MGIIMAIRGSKSKTLQLSVFAFNTSTAAPDAVQFDLEYVNVQYLYFNYAYPLQNTSVGTLKKRHHLHSAG
jgi:hypothetical protein